MGHPEAAEEVTTQQPTLLVEMKGKAIMTLDEPKVSDVSNIKPAESEKAIEVKVYRKWMSRNVPDPNPTGLCFILLDRRVSQYTLLHA